MIRALVFVLVAACSGSSSSTSSPPAEPPPAVANLTPNDLLSGGTPTFIIGTAGDDGADRAIAVQVELIRGLLFSSAPVVSDDTFTTWPDRPIVYGGPHVNALVARLAPTLPFELSPGRLVLGDRTFEGDSYQLITVVPATADHPAFLLYAGTGTPGVGEINGVSHGAAPILVADAFGPLVTGHWQRDASGTVRAVIGDPARRIAWRAVERGHVTFRFPAQLPADDGDAVIIDACMRGVATAVSRLGLEAPAPLDIYVYPDHASKKSLTGNGGDGNAVIASRALHVVRGGSFEDLVAHEATHVLAYEGWGPAGTPMLGEGLAVWVSGAYGGQPLDDYRAAFDAPPPVAELLGPAFRKLPETTTYPLAGLFVDAAIAEVGVDNVRAHLLAASPATWDDACRRAGTTPDALQQAFARQFRRPLH